MVRWSRSRAPGPSTSTLPRCVKSNSPTASRTAACSASVPRYSIGIDQPANGPMCASRARCIASRGLWRRSCSVTIPTGVRGRVPSRSSAPSGVVWPNAAVRCGPRGRTTRARSRGAVRAAGRKDRPGMAEDAYDLIVLGSGTGGYAAAIRASELGKRVAIVEKDPRLGGTCLLRGCVPSKALLESASVMDRINRAAEWGLQASGSADWPKVMESAQHVVDKKVSGLTGLLKARKVDIIAGRGRLVPGPAVDVEGRRVAATDVVLASGSYPRLLPGMEVSERVVTSDQVWAMQSLPGSVVIIGAGAIGMEFATVYRSFGVETTVLEALPRVVPLEDEDISKEAARAFKKRGITAVAGVKVQE